MITVVCRDEAEIGLVVEASRIAAGGGAPTIGDPDTSSPFVAYQKETVITTHSNWFVASNSTLPPINETPGSADLSEWPLVKRAGSYPSDGVNASFLLNNSRCKRRVQLSLADDAPPSIRETVASITPGTHLDAVAGILRGLLTAGGDREIYRDSTTLAPKAIGSGSSRQGVDYNPNCWASAYDFSGVPIWNSASNSTAFGMAAITRRHLACALHYHPPQGSTVEFLGSDGQPVTRTIIAYNTQPAFGSEAQLLIDDRRVAVLDSDLPVSVASYPLIGTWATAEATGGVALGFGGFSLDQARRVNLAFRAYTAPQPSFNEVSYNGTSISITLQIILTHGIFPGPGDSEFLESSYFRSGALGDSGSPIFMPLGASTMALATLFKGGVGGPFPHASILNAMIASADSNAGISTGYTVTVAPDPTA